LGRDKGATCADFPAKTDKILLMTRLCGIFAAVTLKLKNYAKVKMRHGFTLYRQL